jgi:hypothetical protein
MMSICEVSPCSHIAKCTSLQFSTQETPTPSTLIVIQASTLPGLSHVFAGGMDRTVEFKIDISMNLQFKQIMKKSLQQNEGHLLLSPSCSNQRNKHLYSFVSSLTDCVWTHSPQQADKPYHETWTMSEETGWHVQWALTFIAHCLNLTPDAI